MIPQRKHLRLVNRALPSSGTRLKSPSERPGGQLLPSAATEVGNWEEGEDLLEMGHPLSGHCGKSQSWLWLSEGALRLCGVPGSQKVTSEIAFPNIFPSLGTMALFPVFQAGTAWGSLFKLPGCCNSSTELTMLCQSLGSWEEAADQPFVIPRIKTCSWG